MTAAKPGEGGLGEIALRLYQPSNRELAVRIETSAVELLPNALELAPRLVTALETPVSKDEEDRAESPGRRRSHRSGRPARAIDGFRGGNGIGAADVDGDGFTDYVTNYEFDQRYEIAFHPGADGDVRQSWPTATVFVPPVLEKPDDGINP